jgi:hypothetical protein
MADQNESLCHRFQVLLSERLDRALSASELDELQTHLRGCPSCREFASTLRLSDQLARESPAVAPLAAERLEPLVASVMERVEEESAEPLPERGAAPAPGGARGAKSQSHSWREFFSDLGFPSLAGAVALAVLAFFLLRSPQTPVPAPAGRSLDKDLMAPAERRFEETAEKKTQATDALEPPSKTLRADQVAAPQEEAAKAEPSSRELSHPAQESPREPSALEGSAVGAVRAVQEPDSLAALKNLGANPPLSLSQRDSLRAAWSEDLKESSNSKEQAALRAALIALEKLPPPKN